MSRPRARFLKLAVSTFLLGLAAASGGCGKADQGGGLGGSSGGAGGGFATGGSVGTGGSLGGGGASDSVGTGGQADGSSQAGSGGGTGGGGSGGSLGTGGRTNGGGEAGAGGQSDGGGQAGADGSIPDAAQSPDLWPGPDLPVKVDAPLPFWPDAFAAKCVPPTVNGRQETDGHHRAGEDCMTSGCHLNPTPAFHYPGTSCRGSGCHDDGSPDGTGAPAFLFGGTIYRPGATPVADPGVEVGVRAAEVLYSSCTASNGNFWYVAPTAATSLAWPSATTRVRNASGEIAMVTTLAAGCNAALCHAGTYRIVSPL